MGERHPVKELHLVAGLILICEVKGAIRYEHRERLRAAENAVSAILDAGKLAEEVECGVCGGKNWMVIR